MAKYMSNEQALEYLRQLRSKTIPVYRTSYTGQDEAPQELIRTSVRGIEGTWAVFGLPVPKEHENQHLSGLLRSTRVYGCYERYGWL